jgi:hypothetical protein
MFALTSRTMDVSEEHVSMIRVEVYPKQGTRMEDLINTYFTLASLAFSSTLKIQAKFSSETSVTF